MFAVSKRGFHSGLRTPIVNNIQKLLHGDPKAREEGEQLVLQHSARVGRHKYWHEFQAHEVKPEAVEEYKALISEYYGHIHGSDEFDCKLTGSFEVVVGEDLDTFIHIWEYKGVPGFESSKLAIKQSEGHLKTFRSRILPLLRNRSNQLNQEFAFWRPAEPADRGGIYELRSYDLKPGSLLEWEGEWRVGLEARLASGHEPIGAWFSQIGQLHQVHHLWHYSSLEERRITRSKAWKIDEWSQTVSKTGKLTDHMQTRILKPLPFSPHK